MADELNLTKKQGIFLWSHHIYYTSKNRDTYSHFLIEEIVFTAHHHLIEQNTTEIFSKNVLMFLKFGNKNYFNYGHIGQYSVVGNHFFTEIIAF